MWRLENIKKKTNVQIMFVPFTKSISSYYFSWYRKYTTKVNRYFRLCQQSQVSSQTWPRPKRRDGLNWKRRVTPGPGTQFWHRDVRWSVDDLVRAGDTEQGGSTNVCLARISPAYPTPLLNSWQTHMTVTAVYIWNNGVVLVSYALWRKSALAKEEGILGNNI